MARYAKRLTYGGLPSWSQFEKDIARRDPEGEPYWPKSDSFKMELVSRHEIKLAEEYGLPHGSSSYSHKVGYRASKRDIYDFLKFLIKKMNRGDNGKEGTAGDLASSIMTVLGYEWV